MKAVTSSFIYFLIILFFFGCNNSKEDGVSLFFQLRYFLTNASIVTLSGKASKGVIKSGAVYVYNLNSDGSCGTNLLGQTLTDSNGNYSVSYSRTGTPVCLKVVPSGISLMYDERSKQDIPFTGSSSFTSIVAEPTSSKKNKLFTGAFSRIAARRFQELAKNNTDSSNLSSLSSQAGKEVVIRFGLSSPISTASSKSIFTKVLNANDYPELNNLNFDLDDLKDTNTKNIILMNAGFSELANKIKTDTNPSISDIDSVITGFSEDMADGVFDGKGTNGQTLSIGSGSKAILMGNDPLGGIFTNAMQSYIQETGGQEFSGTFTPTNVINTITLNGSTPIVFPVTPTTSTAQTTSTSTSFQTSYSTIVNVSGTYPGTFVLLLNGTFSLTIPSLGSFTFPGSLTNGSNYNVTILTQPAYPGKCTISNSTGTVSNANVNINISCRTFKYSFISTNTTVGTFGSSTAGDNICNTDVNRPDTTSTYKAMLGQYNGSPQRKACGYSAPNANCSGYAGSQATNWVFTQPNVQYRRADGTTIVGTTNSDLVITSFVNAFSATSIIIWTGLENTPAWGTITGTAECTGWTSGFGNYGDASFTNGSLFNISNQSCATASKLLCIEQ